MTHLAEETDQFSDAPNHVFGCAILHDLAVDARDQPQALGILDLISRNKHRPCGSPSLRTTQ